MNGVGDSDIDSCVKDRYHAERAYLFIYREHPLVVREEALIVGVQLDSLYARVVQSVELAYCVRAFEMDAAERNENIVAEQRDGEVVDLRLLMRVCRNVEHRCPVGAAGMTLSLSPDAVPSKAGQGLPERMASIGIAFFASGSGKQWVCISIIIAEASLLALHYIIALRRALTIAKKLI